MAKTDYRKTDLAGLGAFFAIPHSVMDSTGYQALNPSAIRLLLDICRQYSGRNNGRLSPTWELMKDKGWKNQTTLNKAKKELRNSKLITVTRVGSRRKGDCELWALNWYPLHWHESMDIEPTGHDYMGFLDLKDAKIDPITERSKPPALRIVA